MDTGRCLLPTPGLPIEASSALPPLGFAGTAVTRDPAPRGPDPFLETPPIPAPTAHPRASPGSRKSLRKRSDPRSLFLETPQTPVRTAHPLALPGVPPPFLLESLGPLRTASSPSTPRMPRCTFRRPGFHGSSYAGRPTWPQPMRPLRSPAAGRAALASARVRACTRTIRVSGVSHTCHHDI